MSNRKIDIMRFSKQNGSIDVKEELGEIVFPGWANKAYIDPGQMNRLRSVIRAQVEYYEPELVHRDPDGSSIQISSSSNTDLYRKATEDRVTGEINALFNPISYNQLKIIRRFIRSFFVAS